MKIVEPAEIEKRSFEIIEKRLDGRKFPENRRDIIKRVIHTTADFDYADNLKFSEGAVTAALEALKGGADIVADTNMALSGINKKSLAALGGTAHCFMSDGDVAAAAKSRRITRAMVSMEKACGLKKDLIFAIGNAPTALIRLHELIDAGKVKPKLVIGVPVGFVNVIEAKRLTMEGETPYIVSKGNKGGSTVAAAICNALLYQLKR